MGEAELELDALEISQGVSLTDSLKASLSEIVALTSEGQLSVTASYNAAHGLGHGLIGAAVAAWPAVALVGSYELLMMIIRSRPSTAGRHGFVPGA